MKHGHSGRKVRSRTYNSWLNMKDRCNNPKNKQFKDYGGRGIKYVKRWERFEEFLRDMEERPKDRMLNRIDNDKGYSKKNCNWATWEEQVKNKRLRKMGTSKVQGVFFESQSQRWKAILQRNKKKIYLGQFKTEEAAITVVEDYRNKEIQNGSK